MNNNNNNNNQTAITYEQRTVTPDDAQEMLNRMGRNRKIYPTRLQNIEKSINSDKFTVCTNPICFDKNGVLIDGQHRLTAIVETQHPLFLTIAYNVPDDAVLDNGLERNTGDSLYMRGIISQEMSSSKVISVVKRYLTIQRGSTHSFTNDDVGDFINENEEDLRTALLIVPHSGICNNAPCRVAVFSALQNGIEQEVLSNFIRVVNSGYADDGEEQSSAITFRNYLLETKMNGNSIPNRTEAYAEQAIHDFATGTPRRNRYKKEDHIYIPKQKKDASSNQ